MSLPVIIPAHDEAAVIGRLLARLAAPGVSPLVVCNGCSDDTADRARAAGATVIEIAESSKAAALTAGDAATIGWPRAYVDADVEVDADALLAAAATLASPGTLAATVGLEVDTRHASWAVRSYARVWSELPQVREGLAGRGVYVLTEQARRRIGPWPPVADDYAVQRALAPDERTVLTEHRALVTAPSTLRELLRQKARVHAGNRQVGGTAGRHESGLPHVIRHRQASCIDIAVYAAVTAMARVRSRSRHVDWGSPRRSPTATRPRRPITAVVVAYRSASDLDACVDDLVAQLRAIDRPSTVIVVDNASPDDSRDVAHRIVDRYADLATAGGPQVHVLELDDNVGFGRACNAGARHAPTGDVLLVNPDLRLGDGALAALVRAADDGPADCLWGGVRTVDGRPATGSAWRFPSVPRTLAAALALHRLPAIGGRLAEAEPPPATGTRRVDVISGALMLVPRDVWDELDGFDPGFFMYSEDVDLCRRAARLGHDRRVTAAARFVHEGGGSSTGSAGKAAMVLAGKLTDASRRPPAQRVMLRAVLVSGVAWRAAVARVTGRWSSWLAVWRMRDRWIDGPATE